MCRHCDAAKRGHKISEQDGGSQNVEKRNAGILESEEQHKGLPCQNGVCESAKGLLSGIHH
eukprot:13137385-Heterocapsa_arctica.AAC.1